MDFDVSHLDGRTAGAMFTSKRPSRIERSEVRRRMKFDDDGNKLANARATIKHNGVVVHDDIELPHTTPGRITTEDASPAPLYLQDHSNPVVFRNVWVVPKN